MSRQYTADELNQMSARELSLIILAQQAQLQTLNENMELLIEQIRIANQQRFGRKTEKLDQIDGQLSLFDDAENLADPEIPEPTVEEVVSYKRKKQKGKRDSDLEGLPVESVPHILTNQELDMYYGAGNWRRLPTETYKRLRYEPASWTVELHSVDVCVGTGGDHQDEFLRGKRPKDLLKNSIVTPSLGAAILNGKYVLALPLYRIEQEFERNGFRLSRQTMANWVISFSSYFRPMWRRMRELLLELSVVQSDETPTQVIRDGRPATSKSFMWVYRSGEYFKSRQIVLYEYQRTRHHDHPKAFLDGFHGILMTDGLQQYHLLEKESEGITNANCWAHARRDFADACKAMGKANQQAMKQSTAHKALELIAGIYRADETLSELDPEERLKQRQIIVKPLVEAYFAWVREQLSSDGSLLKGKTMEGLNYSLNQEKHLKVFLQDGNVPIDNSAAERAIRPFCIGKKNWVLINSEKGAEASAIMYSIAESAKLNNLKPYMYFKHLLSVLPEHIDKDGNIDPSVLDTLMPWSKTLPEECYKRR